MKELVTIEMYNQLREENERLKALLEQSQTLHTKRDESAGIITTIISRLESENTDLMKKYNAMFWEGCSLKKKLHELEDPDGKIKELVEALEETRSTYSEHISFDDNRKIESILSKVKVKQ